MNRKIISVILALVLSLSLAVNICAASGADLYDEADLLSSTEEARLAEKLADVGARYDAQIVVATVSSVPDDDIDWFVEAIYDTMEMGYGENRNGVLLLVCMDLREYRILSNGSASASIGSGAIDNIGDAILSDLTDGNYAAAFDEFADQCAYYLNGYQNGYPFDFGKNLMICLVIGIIVGVIVAFILKGQLKSVRKQKQANVYVKPGSMQLTFCHDMFLYRNVTKTKKQSSSSSGSGSGSGSSRNVGGGKF